MIKKIIITLLLFSQPMIAQTIAEKRAALSGAMGGLDSDMQTFLTRINEELMEKQEQLQSLYCQVHALWNSGADASSYKELLQEINDVKEHLSILQESWRTTAAKSGRDELYALWDQPDTTLEQLIIDYGSLEYVYLIPPEIGTIEISISSSIPIPKSAWSEMLEQILLENGVGIRPVNPFLRKLYFIKEDFSDLNLITACRKDLAIYPEQSRICFVLTPEPAEVRRTFYFLEKFANPNNTSIQLLGRQILIIGQNAAIKEILKIYDFIDANRGDLEYRAIPLRRVNADEMAMVLGSIFEQMVEPQVACDGEVQCLPTSPTENIGPKIIPLSNIAEALFIVGTREEIEKAEELVCQVESQVGEAHERVIWTYHVKHSDPDELAEMLYRVYLLMVQNQIGYGEGGAGMIDQSDDDNNAVAGSFLNDQGQVNVTLPRGPDPALLYQERFYQNGGYLINPRPIVPGSPVERIPNVGRDNFLVDQKTSSIVMVVEAFLLPQIQEMIRQLDVPKKMVQIEVLLFEKRMKRNTDYGLNLLKLGDRASQTRDSSLCWNDVGTKENPMPENAGALQIVFSRMKSSCFPAFDWIYKFMMTQDDIHLNSSPSVVTVNQTPATIAIKDEISINTGIFEIPTEGTTALKDAFTRAQYGITIVVTPTIHMHDEYDYLDDPTDYITLQTDITFDTFIPGGTKDRPDVNRRNIVNEVRIPDGQTVILGGLRRKDTRDAKQTIPFLGEIPGVGKLFSQSSLQDNTTEMFIFITPKIISDPSEDFRRIREQELCKRPGDIPAFLCRLSEAQDREKNRLFQQWMTFLFGEEKPDYYCEEGEYDGR